MGINLLGFYNITTSYLVNVVRDDQPQIVALEDLRRFLAMGFTVQEYYARMQAIPVCEAVSISAPTWVFDELPVADSSEPLLITLPSADTTVAVSRQVFKDSRMMQQLNELTKRERSPP